MIFGLEPLNSIKYFLLFHNGGESKILDEFFSTKKIRIFFSEKAN